MANQADFAPTLGALKDLRPFVFWAQTTLPTVFDDSLSYYEVLTKLCKMVNSLLENEDTNAENIEALATAYQELQDFTNNYFENLDVTQEVSDKVDSLVADGTIPNLVLNRADTILNTYLYGEDGESGVNKDIEDLIADANADISLALSNFATDSNHAISQFELNGRGAITTFEGQVDAKIAGIDDIVEDWMHDNFTNPSSVVIDSTLTVSGAAADAQATGKLMDDAENMVLATAYWQNYMIDALSQYFILADSNGGSNVTVSRGAPSKTMNIANVTAGETYLVSGVAASYSGTRYIPAYALGNVTYDTVGNPHYEFYDVFPRGWDDSVDPGTVYQYVRNRSVRIPTGTSIPITHLFIMSDDRIPITARCSRLNVRTDDTLTSENLPAQGKATGDAINTKIPWPVVGTTKDVGNSGNKLLSNGDGTVSWVTDNSEELEGIVYNGVLGNVPFTQGSLASSGVITANTTRLRCQFVPLQSLVKAVCGGNGWLTWYAYDAKRNFISRNTVHTQKIEIEDIDAVGAEFVKFVFGVDGNPNITPDDAETYSLKLYTNRYFYTVASKPLTYDVLKAYLNENNELVETLNYRFYLDKNDVKNKIFSIRARYSGDEPPSFRLNAYPPASGMTLFGPAMQFIGKDEFITQDFRLPNDYSIASYQINLVIPDGSKLVVDDCSYYDDDSRGYGDCGVVVNAHRGLDCLFPGDCYEGIMAAGKCGFKSCITIPKFTSDGVGVCFHNDGGASSPLSEQLSLEDGSPIPGMTNASKISDYTYDELMQWSIGATRNAVYAGCKILKLDDFFGICSKYGMHPILSIHPVLTVEQWEQIKAMTDKWGLTQYLSVKSGNYNDVWGRVISVYGDGVIERIINIYSTTSTYNIINQINTGKTATGIVLTPVHAEFYDRSLSGDTYGSIQMAQLEAAISAGIHTSVILQAATNTAKMRYYVDKGVNEFTNGRFVNCGLIW